MWTSLTLYLKNRWMGTGTSIWRVKDVNWRDAFCNSQPGDMVREETTVIGSRCVRLPRLFMDHKFPSYMRKCRKYKYKWKPLESVLVIMLSRQLLAKVNSHLANINALNERSWLVAEFTMSVYEALSTVLVTQAVFFEIQIIYNVKYVPSGLLYIHNIWKNCGVEKTIHVRPRSALADKVILLILFV